MIVTILKKFWKEIVFGLIIISLSGTIFIKNGIIIDNKKVIKSLETDLILEKERLITCNATITNQNQQIDSAAKEAEQKLKELTNIKNLIEQLDVKQKDELKFLRNQQVPETCDDTKKLLRDNIKDFKW